MNLAWKATGTIPPKKPGQESMAERTGSWQCRLHPEPSVLTRPRHRCPNALTVNPRVRQAATAFGAVPARVLRKRLASAVEGVPEALELGDEPSGVGSFLASPVPVGSSVVWGSSHLSIQEADSNSAT